MNNAGSRCRPTRIPRVTTSSGSPTAISRSCAIGVSVRHRDDVLPDLHARQFEHGAESADNGGTAQIQRRDTRAELGQQESIVQRQRQRFEIAHTSDSEQFGALRYLHCLRDVGRGDSESAFQHARRRIEPEVREVLDKAREPACTDLSRFTQHNAANARMARDQSIRDEGFQRVANRLARNAELGTQVRFGRKCVPGIEITREAAKQYFAHLQIFWERVEKFLDWGGPPDVWRRLAHDLYDHEPPRSPSWRPGGGPSSISVAREQTAVRTSGGGVLVWHRSLSRDSQIRHSPVCLMMGKRGGSDERQTPRSHAPPFDCIRCRRFHSGRAAAPDIALAQAAPVESRLDTVLKRGKLFVATFSTNPPVCFVDESGKPAGFDIDITRLIARGLLNDETKVDFITVDSSGRWPAASSGRADFGIAATTIYPDRAIRLAFTGPHMDSESRSWSDRMPGSGVSRI